MVSRNVSFSNNNLVYFIILEIIPFFNLFCAVSYGIFVKHVVLGGDS